MGPGSVARMHAASMPCSILHEHFRDRLNSCQNYFAPHISHFLKNLAAPKCRQHLCEVSFESLCRQLKRLWSALHLRENLRTFLSNPSLQTTCKEDPPFHGLTEDRLPQWLKEIATVPVKSQATRNKLHWVCTISTRHAPSIHCIIVSATVNCDISLHRRGAE